jgi:alcohol dehydrogenase, propanol-preferring
MKCFVLDEPRNPLQLTAVADPAPSPDELLVRIDACGVCHSDVHLADGEWPELDQRRVRPTVLGHEIVGTVIERGERALRFEPGRHVGVGWVGETCGQCAFCQEGCDNLCDERRITGVDRAGGYADHALIRASQAIPVPDGLTAVEAAPLFCAGVTVYRGLKKAAIAPGKRVAVYGIGGLGHLALQIARAWHAETIAVDTDAGKLELAREMGARHVLAADAAPGEILSGGGADVAVVTAPAKEAYVDATRSLRKGGTIVVIGIPNALLRFNPDDVVTREIRIVGSSVGSRDDIRDVLAMAAAGKIRCVTETLPLDDVNEALSRLREGRVRGRLVLVP